MHKHFLYQNNVIPLSGYIYGVKLGTELLLFNESICGFNSTLSVTVIFLIIELFDLTHWDMKIRNRTKIY